MSSKERNIENLRDRIRRVVRNRNGHSARFDTSDIIQETELQLWLNGHDDLKDDKSSNVDQALIATIAKGHLAKQVRNHRAGKRDATLDCPVNDQIQSHDRDPCEIASRKEETNRLLSCINKLDEVSQRILFLHYFCGSTFVEIQSELGLTRQRLQTRFKKAAHELRLLMTR